MDFKWFWVLLVMMLVSLREGCWEEERTALLQLKHFFLDPNNFLHNWVENSECCRWERVKCDNITGRVITLDLFCIRDWNLGEWHLNASLFSPFQQLQSLNLSRNNIAGYIENECFERLSRLSNLEELNLAYNNFNNSILSSLACFSSLKYLDLSENRFEGAVNIEGIYSLKNLKELDMSWNNIDQFVSLKGLSNLEVMDLSFNNLNNSILSSLGGLSSLKYLYLEYIGLNGTVDVEGLQSLENLEELHMGRNRIDKFVNSKDYRGLKKLNALSLSGIETTDATIFLQSTLRLFPFLKTLDLSYNSFNRTMITRELHNLTTLEELNLDWSKLHISFLQTVATCTSLKHLSMIYGKLNGISEVQGPINFKSLESLFMDGTTFNNSFRQIIRPIVTLKKLSLQNCGLGTLHDQGFCEMVHLEELDISYNALRDTLSPCLANLTSLQLLDISSNQITGNLSGLCEMVHLEKLYIGRNTLRDTLPPCFANLTSLQSLDISSNQITGNLSSSPLKDMTSLRVLRISDNLLQIPISLSPFYNLSKLKEFASYNNPIYIETMPHSLTPKFQLNSISLSGYGYGATFPRFLYHQHDLYYVDLFDIKLNGGFPNWLIENNTKLEGLYLSNNSLSGPFLLPTHSHKNLSILDISINSFSGQIPIEVGAFFPSLWWLNISRNALNGSIPSSFGDMSSLERLDLSHNQLSGEIPEHLNIGCLSLEYLVLSNNSLEGPVFSKIINLTNLVSLYLDSNNFIGQIL